MKPFLKLLSANFRSGWKSSLVGLVLFAATLLSVFKVEAVTWLDAVVPLMLSLLLLFAPRQLRKTLVGYLGKGSIPMLLLLIISCSASKPTEGSYPQPPQGTVTEQTVRATAEAEVKNDSAEVRVSADQLTPGASFKQESARAISTVNVDKSGLITSKCNCKGETDADTVIVTVRTETPPTPAPLQASPAEPEERLSLARWLTHNIIVPVLVLFIALIVLLLIARFIKSLFLQLFTPAKTTGHEQ